MILTEIKPKLYHAKFLTQYEMCMTMLRLQEFYESPYKEIKGKYFEVEEYMDRYVKDLGKFTYCEVWNGFNVPGQAINDFLKIHMPGLRPRENMLFNNLEKLYSNFCINPDYYFIATVNDNVIMHETAHAYYYLKPKYKQEIDNLISKIPSNYKSIYYKQLLKKGYCKEVLDDEIQAYFLDSYNYGSDLLLKTGIGAVEVLNEKTKQLFKPFYNIFKKYDK